MMALSSALLFVVFVFEDFGDLESMILSAPPWGLIARYLVAMAFGGAVAGFLLAGLFGRRGVLGWVEMAIAGVATTMVAGILGSLFGLLPDLMADGWQNTDLVAVAAGALVLPLAATGWAPLVSVWAALVVITHVWAHRLRRGRIGR